LLPLPDEETRNFFFLSCLPNGTVLGLHGSSEKAIFSREFLRLKQQSRADFAMDRDGVDGKLRFCVCLLEKPKKFSLKLNFELELHADRRPEIFFPSVN
jgi:hypothetical protein